MPAAQVRAVAAERIRFDMSMKVAPDHSVTAMDHDAGVTV
jgi:hypothetical protein